MPECGKCHFRLRSVYSDLDGAAEEKGGVRGKPAVGKKEELTRNRQASMQQKQNLMMKKGAADPSLECGSDGI